MQNTKMMKKLTKVMIVHRGENSLAEAVNKAVVDQLHSECVKCNLKKTTSIEQLKFEKDDENGSVRGICIITPQLLKFLDDSPKSTVEQLKDGLMKDMLGFPLFVCVKHNVSDEEVKKILPNTYDNTKVLTLEEGRAHELCVDIYKQWFGNAAYVDNDGNHCVNEDDDPPQKINCVYIIHAEEDKQFLKGLSDALEEVANPECSCNYRRSDMKGEDIGKQIVNDINQFVGKCSEERNKCIIIVNQHLIDVLSKTQLQADNFKNAILLDLSKEGKMGHNFVLLELEENKMFSDSNFSSIKVTYDKDNLKKVAKDAVNIWLNKVSPDSKPDNESPDSKPGLNKWVKAAGVVGGAAALGVATVAAAPVVLGFGATGIASGSWAASMMSAAAVANGGGVAAGSMVAILQSLGATGLTAGAAAVGAVGGGAGGVAGVATAAAVNKSKD